MGGHLDAKSLLKWEKTLAKFFVAKTPDGVSSAAHMHPRAECEWFKWLTFDSEAIFCDRWPPFKIPTEQRLWANLSCRDLI